METLTTRLKDYGKGRSKPRILIAKLGRMAMTGAPR